MLISGLHRIDLSTLYTSLIPCTRGNGKVIKSTIKSIGDRAVVNGIRAYLILEKRLMQAQYYYRN